MAARLGARRLAKRAGGRGPDGELMVDGLRKPHDAGRAASPGAAERARERAANEAKAGEAGLGREDEAEGARPAPGEGERPRHRAAEASARRGGR